VVKHGARTRAADRVQQRGSPPGLELAAQVETKTSIVFVVANGS
jgi:hypothetical protein